ncbi:DUF1080 domain-containing protein [bacterium]|nr:DUF1080 domain-containing protein [bacterium]
MKSLLCLLIPLFITGGYAPAEDGTNLLANGLKGWSVAKPGAWQVDDGVLHPSEKPEGYIWTEKPYENFELSLDYKTSEKCNSGVFFRTDPQNPVQGGFEIQVASHGLYSGKHIVGALYDAKSPSESAGKPDGEWNQMKITCVGPNIQVVLNGKNVLNANLDKWTTPKLNPDGTKNKFKTALKKLPRTGNIGFQYHGHPVWFRNVVIRKK